MEVRTCQSRRFLTRSLLLLQISACIVRSISYSTQGIDIEVGSDVRKKKRILKGRNEMVSFECSNSVVIYLNEIRVFLLLLEFWCKRLVFRRGSFHENRGSDSKLDIKIIYVFIRIGIGIGIGILALVLVLVLVLVL